MLIDYNITGCIRVPDGSKMIEGTNEILLPTGDVVSVHPIIEGRSAVDADDYRNLDYEGGKWLGVYVEDYDRNTEVSDVPDPD